MRWAVDWRKWNETWSIKCRLKEMRWNMNNEVDNVTSPFFEFKLVKNKRYTLFLCLFVYKITHFVQLAGIQITIQHSSKYLFSFPNNPPRLCSNCFVLIDGVALSEGMSVLGGTSFLCCCFARLYNIFIIVFIVGRGVLPPPPTPPPVQ